MEIPTNLLEFDPILITAPQRSPEWRQARLGNVTGSETKNTFLFVTDTERGAAIRKILEIDRLTAGIKESPEFLELWNMDKFELMDKAEMEISELAIRRKYRQTRVAERLTGLDSDPEKFVSYEMKWGITNEKLAAAKYRLETGNVLDEAYFHLHPHLRVGASPDGMVIDRKTGELGVAEIKCLKTDNHLYDIIKYGKIPDEYLVQCHMEMWLSCRSFCDFVGYDSRVPGKLDMFHLRLERDDEYLKTELIPQVIRFLDQCDKDERYFRMMARLGAEKMKEMSDESAKV